MGSKRDRDREFFIETVCSRDKRMRRDRDDGEIDAMQQLIKRLRASCSADDAKVALEALRTIAHNVIDQPLEGRVHRIRMTAGRPFYRKVGRLSTGRELMLVLGFVHHDDTGDSGSYYQAPIGVGYQEVMTRKWALLKEALNESAPGGAQGERERRHLERLAALREDEADARAERGNA